MTPLVLASTSRYRRELLARLGLPFTVDRPDVDESPRPGEAPAALARRLAEAKARDVAARHPGAWVLGSDQVADRDGQPLGKPGDRDTAHRQLAAASGREVQFHTAFCLVRDDAPALDGLDLTRVRFRVLDDAAILRYLDAEQPYDCAGSFKCEGLGISLFEAIENRDPTALVGLPLIAVAQALRRAGYRLP
ncbi:MAG TPA: nucleoside triphosphate pyrophosphatase [Arenimonas sp.]|uniref:Maf family protein n=1 Tax=Arenimonas sp. TaxID=1872635 RepID=UPI002D806C5D|nr:nucleoside triphosphate pyrophosphatase [Arenimonas sp.]HEU0153090.1 nucleoside triphosphate pyrophosphatase [Arenimonas sp.]